MQSTTGYWLIKFSLISLHSWVLTHTEKQLTEESEISGARPSYSSLGAWLNLKKQKDYRQHQKHIQMLM
jgi:hypothetical protein